MLISSFCLFVSLPTVCNEPGNFDITNMILEATSVSKENIMPAGHTNTGPLWVCQPFFCPACFQKLYIDRVINTPACCSKAKLICLDAKTFHIIDPLVSSTIVSTKSNSCENAQRNPQYRMHWCPFHTSALETLQLTKNGPLFLLFLARLLMRYNHFISKFIAVSNHICILQIIELYPCQRTRSSFSPKLSLLLCPCLQRSIDKTFNLIFSGRTFDEPLLVPKIKQTAPFIIFIILP
mmetsp:Transcript_28978/g.69982  ORF Transcript_28978/g.69982 Transcript_28978/m.69982 type:complete len:237 (+) Transcript_28978:283-993(+)